MIRYSWELKARRLDQGLVYIPKLFKWLQLGSSYLAELLVWAGSSSI